MISLKVQKGILIFRKHDEDFQNKDIMFASNLFPKKFRKRKNDKCGKFLIFRECGEEYMGTPGNIFASFL